MGARREETVEIPQLQPVFMDPVVRPLCATTVAWSMLWRSSSTVLTKSWCANVEIRFKIRLTTTLLMWVSVLAARWFAAFSLFVRAPSAAFCPCGSTHSFL